VSLYIHSTSVSQPNNLNCTHFRKLPTHHPAPSHIINRALCHNPYVHPPHQHFQWLAPTSISLPLLALTFAALLNTFLGFNTAGPVCSSLHDRDSRIQFPVVHRSTPPISRSPSQTSTNFLPSSPPTSRAPSYASPQEWPALHPPLPPTYH